MMLRYGGWTSQYLKKYQSHQPIRHLRQMKRVMFVRYANGVWLLSSWYGLTMKHSLWNDGCEETTFFEQPQED